MLQKFFFNLYTALIGLFDKGKPRLVDLAFYRESIFNPVGLWTLVAAAGLAMIFYFVVNGKDTAAYLREYGPSRPKWLLTLLLAAGTGAWLAYYIGLRLGALPELFFRYFIIVNALVAMLWFGLASLLAKLRWFSSNARSTPF